MRALDQQLAAYTVEAVRLQTDLRERDSRVTALTQELANRNKSLAEFYTSNLNPIGRLRRMARHSPEWRSLHAHWLAHLRYWRATRSIARSHTFDKEWYLKKNPDVAALGIEPISHYLLYGAREGRDPGPTFSTRGYLSHYPDVRAAGLNPLEHFVRYGIKEKGALARSIAIWRNLSAVTFA